jgi:predicted aspartyl protease
MSTAFDPQRGLIVVPADLVGPSGSAIIRFALDTGATGTLINVGLLVAVGYDPALSPDRIQVTTGSGVEFVPRVLVQQLTALGHTRTNFAVLGHTLPPSASVDGLLGLDFLRGQVLAIDFRQGRLSLS